MTHFFLIQQRHLLNTIFFERYDIEKHSVLLYWEPFPFLAMAGQRTGRSRFGFKMVLLAVLWCALHLKDLKAYQTLAVPGSGAPNKAELQKMTVPQLRAKLREKGKKVSGKKDELIERLLPKRNIPKAGDTAIDATDVFIPLDKTVQKLEDLLEEERVVFIRAGVASGKSTLAEHLARTQSSKYLQVHPPKTKKVFSEESWENELRKTLLKENSTKDVAYGDLDYAFQRLYENDQVLIFDECHLLFSCPAFCQLLVKKPGYLQKRLKVLMLSAASEAANEQGAIYTTPAEITAKYMWTPPMPNASQLVHQLAAADVYLEEDAFDFFMCLCGGHRSLFMRAMQWVHDRQMKEKKSARWDIRPRWDIRQALGEARHSWGNGNWTATDTLKRSSLLGMLLESRAICVNGKYKDASNIPDEFVEILCQGASGSLKPAVRRDLTIHGFILPSGPSATKRQEFEPYNWNLVGARYGVSNPFLAAYYRNVLEETRELKVDVDREVTSCIDLLLRALPYLNFAEVVAFTVQDERMPGDLSAEDLPFEAQYTSAIIRVLNNHGFEYVAFLEDGTEGKVDIYCKQGETTFAIEAVMAARSPAGIAEHRSRFDNASRPNYQQAAKKCLVIIGKLESVQKRVREVQGGIEVVGLVPNEGHVAYTVCVKEGEGVVEFPVECDRVAKKLISLNKDPYFEPAQRLQSISPGWVALKQMSSMTYIHVSSFHDANWSVAVSLTFFLTSC